MANITPTLANDSIPVIIAQEALGKLGANVVLAGLVRRDYETDVAQYGATVQIAKRGALVVNDKVSDASVTLQAPADSSVSVTLNKHKEVSFIIEDITRAQAKPDLLTGYAEDAAIALAEQLETDLFDAIRSATYTVGTAGTDVTPAVVRAARKKLNDNKVPVNGRYLILSTKDDDALLGNAQITQAFDASDSAAKDGQLRPIWGFQPRMSQLVATSGSSPVTTWNVALNPNGLALVTRPLALAPAGMGAQQAVVNSNGVVMRVTMSYDTDVLGYKVTLDILYGIGIVRPEFIVAVKG